MIYSETSCFEFISAEQAREYLKLSGGNRVISDSCVRKYANDIRNKTWSTTGQGIAFDITGRLIDGHHRLLAIIQENAGVRSLVVRGLPLTARDVTDTGKPRSLPNIETLNGKENGTMRVSRARAIANIWTPQTVSLSHPQFERVYETFQEGLDWSVRTFTYASCGRLSIAPMAGAFAFCWCHAHREAVEEFGQRVATNNQLVPGSMGHVLHKYVNAESSHVYRDSRSRSRKLNTATDPSRVMMRKIIRAVQVALEGKTIAPLQDSKRGRDYFEKIHRSEGRNLDWLFGPQEELRYEASEESIDAKPTSRPHVRPTQSQAHSPPRPR